MDNLMAAMIITCNCADAGERMLSNCTDASSAVCWPCEAGFACRGGEQAPCADGLWSTRGSGECAPCSLRCPGTQIQLLPCTRTSDRVCVGCPPGYRCDTAAEPCPANTYSDGAGGCAECPRNTTSGPGSTECVPSACGPGEFATHSGGCLRCPDGFGCDPGGSVTPCAENSYSADGRCRACDPHALSPERSSSVDACVCTAGYVKAAGGGCAECRAGTFWNESACQACDPGFYCAGRTHRDVCPLDMFSHAGSVVCTDCRPFSGCARPPCVDGSSCTCDDGYVDHGGECARCRPGTFKANDSCVPCAPGFECLGGPDVRACELGAYSGVNRTRCEACTECRQITAARCNATHDSVCAPTTAPLAVIAIRMDFRTELDSETFVLFAMIFASSLPKARLMSVCDLGQVCMRCFQGVCPAQKMRGRLIGPAYSVAIEVRADSSRVYQNVEALSQTSYLSDAASGTMRKLTDLPFTLTSKMEYEVMCPDGKLWDPRLSLCYRDRDEASPRTWLGLAAGIGLLVAIGVYGGRRYRAGWMRMGEDENS